MQVRQTVDIPATFIYEQLLCFLQEDYFGATGQKIARQDLVHGLIYQKTFGKKGGHTVQVMVDELIQDQLYKVAISSNRGVQWISYELEEKPDGQTQISYTEDYLPNGRFNAWNYKLLLPLMRKSLEQRMQLQITKLVEFTQQKEVHEDER